MLDSCVQLKRHIRQLKSQNQRDFWSLCILAGDNISNNVLSNPNLSLDKIELIIKYNQTTHTIYRTLHEAVNRLAHRIVQKTSSLMTSTLTYILTILFFVPQHVIQLITTNVHSVIPTFVTGIITCIGTITGTVDDNNYKCSPCIKMVLNQYAWCLILSNPNVTLEFIHKYNIVAKAGRHAYTYLSLNPNVTEQYILEHITEAWSDWRLVFNNNISIQFYIKYKHLMCNKMGYSFLFRLECHPKLTIADIRQYGVKCWNSVSNNPAITIQDIINNPDLPWVWRYVTINPSVTQEYINSNPHLPWVHDMIIMNPNVSFDYHQTQPYFYRQYNLVGPVTSTIYDDINRNNIKYENLSSERHLNLQFVINNINRNWHWYTIFGNPFDGNINRLQLQLNRLRIALAKQFYWNAIEIMSKPPHGYYFLNDFESTIISSCPDDTKKQLFHQLRKERRHHDIERIFMQ